MFFRDFGKKAFDDFSLIGEQGVMRIRVGKGGSDSIALKSELSFLDVAEVQKQVLRQEGAMVCTWRGHQGQELLVVRTQRKAPTEVDHSLKRCMRAAEHTWQEKQKQKAA